MERDRLTAFSDGVLAIIITIMVLELKPPHSDDWRALLPLWPTFCAYMLSFLYIGIYWNNHHHLFYAIAKVNGAILWANMNLLFWLSLLPFTTAYMSENYFAAVPVAVYGVSLLAPAFAYYVLAVTMRRSEGEDSLLARALGADFKGKISLVCYLVGIALAFVDPWLGEALYVAVALLWLIPDRRIERQFMRD